MLKVLLVDDEPFILQGLAALIDWQAQGFEIAGMAENGREALEILNKRKADLVIADIRMPEMSGLELLEAVRAGEDPDLYFVLLSGYNDFAYAKKAIQNACVDYILKPVQKEELLNLLKRVSALHADSVKRQKEAGQQEKAYFTRNLISILCGKYDAINLKYVSERLCTEGGLRYITVELDRQDEGVQALLEEEKRRLQRRLYEICLGILPEYTYHCVFDVSREEERYDIGLIYCGRMAREAGISGEEYLDELLGEIRTALEAPVVMLVGNHVETVSELGESYRTAAVARSFQDFRPNRERTPIDGSQGGQLCKEAMDALVSAVEENDREKIARCAERIYEEINRKSMDRDIVDLNIHYLLFQLVHLAAVQDRSVNQEEIFRYISENAFHSGTIHGSLGHFIQFAEEYADYLVQLRGKNVSGVLSDIEREVRENYGRNLTLKELGQKYYVNAAYLGQLFRKQYGMSFKDYLNSCRIEKAAELLLHTDKKVYEVAEEVGYHDLDYFINRFIAAKGCTPARFRKQSREERK